MTVLSTDILPSNHLSLPPADPSKRLEEIGQLMDEYNLPLSRVKKARTKIVATVGPSCFEPSQLAILARSGVSVFRLNMAHAGPEQQQPHVDHIRQVSEQLNEPLAILVDLAGPKFRLGVLPDEGIFCGRDETFFLVKQDPSSPNELVTSYQALVDELSVGDLVMLADGTVSMRVEELLPDRARLRVEQHGIIRSRQGINLPGVKLSAPAISVEDHQHAIWAAKAGIDFVSLSFVRSPDEVRTLKDILRSNSSTARVIAKIEKREALDRLEEIVAEADGIMVARGDLGVEIDVAEMPLAQKRIIRVCHEYHKPVIIATQMLDSMHESQRPTRAEATDVANAVLDGADACMLSGETAIGKHPRLAVEMMNRIAQVTEQSLEGQPIRQCAKKNAGGLHEVTSAIVRGAGTMAHSLNAKLVVVASHSGRTALALSQQRSFSPTIGVSTKESTLRLMCLYWGVTPLRNAPAENIEQLIKSTDEWACRVGLTVKGDRIVIVGGSHLTAGQGNKKMSSGVHDIVVVHEVEGLTE
ncbi:pyruvate kinase [Bythopirellula polymerisocia]|uniref:Pyruvate kinase n=1 Tax=Bythopirellula polymerisocia TaxID=2528003 RepID=A0A5C6CGQ0_9BACT|nr:pyruvate kinase [Bythopirellula polymerisocia]TWU23830.1 Pyruvate kinase [Bythopirellula polymerisocia]